MYEHEYEYFMRHICDYMCTTTVPYEYEYGCPRTSKKVVLVLYEA